MSEKYPQAWRDTCLSLLRAHKEEVRKSLGFKRLGWDVIRDRIMRSYDQYENGEIFLRDDRLVRQNIESWEKGRNLSDEKFDFIDKYVRQLAASGDDDAAFLSLRKMQFEKGADALSDMYNRRKPRALIPNDFFNDFPWAFCADEIIGTWYKSLAMFSLSEHRGVLKVLFAYLPKNIDDLKKRDYKNVVFMEGFLIPLEYNGQKSDIGDLTDVDLDDLPTINTLKCAVKLTRPEFQGLSGIGYADGEIHIPNYDEYWEYSPGLRMLILEYPSPIPCPTISREWTENRLGEEVALDGHNIDTTSNRPDNNVVVFNKYEFQFQIILKFVVNFDDSRLRDMVVSSYAGYIY